MLSESTSALVGGGNSMEGMSAVGCEKKIVFPVTPFCCTFGSPLPRRICFQQQRPREASILVALEESRTWIFSRPIQLSFAHASKGSLGFVAPRSVKHSQQAHTGTDGSPMPAHVGNASTSCEASLARNAAVRLSSSTGTLRECKSQRHSGWSGCCTLEACSSSVGINGHLPAYRDTSSKALTFSGERR